MAKRITVSVPEGDEDLIEWADGKHEDGMFQSRSHVMMVALRRMKKDGQDVEEFLS